MTCTHLKRKKYYNISFDQPRNKTKEEKKRPRGEFFVVLFKWFFGVFANPALYC
jgi:hypothetical protein